jgi:hypothetical protein
MRCALRRLHSPDVYDLRAYRPETPTHFGVLIQAMIGPEGGLGEESFDFVLCTPSWLTEKATQQGWLWGRGYAVALTYDYGRMQAAVQSACAEASGSSWEEIAAILNRRLLWEFSDYREAQSNP